MDLSHNCSLHGGMSEVCEKWNINDMFQDFIKINFLHSVGHEMLLHLIKGYQRFVNMFDYLEASIGQKETSCFPSSHSPISIYMLNIEPIR